MTRQLLIFIGFVILIVLLFISFAFNIYYNITDKETPKADTTIVTRIQTDTLKDTIPTVKYEKQVYFVKDTVAIETIFHDTVTKEIKAITDIPITQKKYSDDSTYIAYVSGYKQKLDSINIYKKTIFVDKTTTITKKDNKNFGIGPVIFGGYGIQNKKLEWGIGIGVSYNILNF